MLKVFFLQNLIDFVFIADLFEKYSAFTGLVGVIIGILLSCIVSIIRDNYRFNKEKKGAIKIINSEIETNLIALKKFRDDYLLDFPDNSEKITCQGVNNFYNHLEKFPSFSHNSWDDLLRYVPSIYGDNQIKKILEFNKNLNDLHSWAKALSYHQLPINGNYHDFEVFHVDYGAWKDFMCEYKLFENQLNSLIVDGEVILEF